MTSATRQLANCHQSILNERLNDRIRESDAALQAIEQDWRADNAAYLAHLRADVARMDGILNTPVVDTAASLRAGYVVKSIWRDPLLSDAANDAREGVGK